MKAVRAEEGAGTQDLEINLRPKLHGARIAERTDSSEGSAGYVRADEASIVSKVKEVEGLSTKLDPDTLTKPYVL